MDSHTSDIIDLFIHMAANKAAVWVEEAFTQEFEFGDEEPGDEEIKTFMEMALRQIAQHGMRAVWWAGAREHALAWHDKVIMEQEAK